MTQYIDKSALVAEIERQISAIDNYPKLTDTQIAVLEGNKVVLAKFLSFLDTLEVKQVDLEKELVDYHNENFSPCNDGTLLSCETGAKLTWNDYESIAKHFFELGLRLQTETNITFKYNIGKSVREYKAQKGEKI